MVEVIRWISLGILWACIFVNAYCIAMNRKFQKRYEEAYKNCMSLLTFCENCEHYNPDAVSCPNSGMKMIGKYGSCCYVKRKDKKDEGENHD